MKKLLSISFLLIFLTACGTTNDETSPPPDIDRNEGMSDTGENGVQTDEEQLVEARHEAQIDIENKKDYTHYEAEQLVKKHLHITNKSDTVVIFDHEEGDKYFIRVHDVLNDDQHSKKGMYIVDPKTGEISNAKKD